jgi:hypothetical protein
MSLIAQQLDKTRQRIQTAAKQAGRTANSIKLIAVTKRQPVHSLQMAMQAGQRCFAESYLQEALSKIMALPSTVEWHFIGPMQSNKTAQIAQHFSWVHSVDRFKIAQRLSQQRQGPPLNICLQVNTSGEASKSGITPDEINALASQVNALPNLRLRGLMTIPARSDNMQQQREPFNKLKALFDELNTKGFELDTLSMGMSNDLEAAILEGATMVRIGTDIFGQRDA